MILAVFAVACFTYSASITVERSKAMAADGLAAAARAAIAQVAETFHLDRSPIDLEGMKQAAADDRSEYRPLAVYRNTIQSGVLERGRIILVLQQHEGDGGMRVIIRDLQREEATPLTEAIEEEIVKRLTAEVGSDNVRVQRGRVGRSIYAP